jgi:hypothetical protein
MKRILSGWLLVMGTLVSLVMSGCGAGASVLAGGEIEPGVYSGTLTSDMTMQVYVQQESVRENSNFTIVINEAGNVVYEGNEYYPGAILTKQLAGATAAEQVTNITRGDGLIAIDCNVAMGMTLPDGSYLDVAGYGHETYRSNVLGGLDYLGDYVIANSAAGIVMTGKVKGTLYR